MKLKAKYKWNGRSNGKPVYFSWNVGLQYKTLTGYSEASIFCNKRKWVCIPIANQIRFILCQNMVLDALLAMDADKILAAI